MNGPLDPTDPEASAERSRYRGKVKPGVFQKISVFFRENEWFWAIAFLLVVFFLFARQFRIQPPPALPLGSVATRDVRASFDLRILDKVATEQRRTEARARVIPVYDWDTGLSAEISDKVSSAFRTARVGTEEFDKFLHSGSLTGDERKEAEETYLDRLSETLGGSLSRFALKQFQSNDFDPPIESVIRDMVIKVEGQKIVANGDSFQGAQSIRIRDIRKKDSEWEQKNPAASDILTLNEARRLPGTMVEGLSQVPSQLRGAIEEYVRGIVQPNLTYNSQETNERREKAAAQVEDLVVYLKKGAVLVKAGDHVDEGAYQKIEAYREASRGVVNYQLLAALFLFLLLLLAFTFMYLKTYRKHYYPQLNLFVLTLQVATVFVFIVQAFGVLVRLVAEGSKSDFLARPEILIFAIPVAAGSMLMTLLVDRHIGVVYTLLFSVLFGIFMDFDFGMLLFCMLSSFAAIYAGAKMAQRTAQWKASLLVAAVNVPLAAGVLALKTDWDTPFPGALIPLVAAFVAGFPFIVMLVTPLLPVFEVAFGILTEVRLLELSNMNHPLLKRLALDAPGTYNHSLMMAALSEAAANAIGANALYCRVACYYHDVGKMLNPAYFVENQEAGQNPHDKLAPRISALIVGAHVKEGIAMGRQYKLPQAIIDVIPEHHGTRKISYFLDKALTMLDPEKESINEADFCYPGPKPRSREAAVIMLADGVEAASRVIKDPSHQRLKAMIDELVNRVVAEGQLSECDLTFKDLSRVKEAFYQILLGAFSRRVSYPGYSFDKEEKDDAARGPVAQPSSQA